MLHTLFLDVRYAIRGLLNARGFTLAVLVSLTLGIGVNVAVFAVVEAVLLRPLPIENGEKLVVLNHRDRGTGVSKEYLAVGDYVDLVDQATSFESMGTYGAFEQHIFGHGEPIRVVGLSASPGAVRALRMRVLHGRSIEPRDALAGAEPVLVMGHALWTGRFGADPSLVGRSVRLAAGNVRVIGIATPGFAFPLNAVTDVVVPAVTPTTAPSDRRDGWLPMVARLADGVDLERANRELLTLSRKFEADFPQSNAATEYSAVSLRDHVAGSARRALILLIAAVGLLLTLACVNVGNLVLARSLARRQEMGVRLALGAGRPRLLAQLLTESMVLSGLGAMLGIALAHFGARAIVTLVPSSVSAPGLAAVRVSGTVLAYSALITVLAALVFAAMSSFAVDQSAVNGSLVETSRMSMGRKARRLASSLVMLQVALAVVLMVSASLIVRTFSQLVSVDPGFRAEQVLTMQLQLPADRYGAPQARQLFWSRLAAELPAQARIAGAGLATVMPMTGNNWTLPLIRPEQSAAEGQRPPDLGFQVASGGYFAAMGIPLLRGRVFDRSESPESPPVVIISQEVERRYFAGESALGKRLRVGAELAEIVGIVGDIRRASLRDQPSADLYLSFERGAAMGANLFLLSSGDPLDVAGTVQSALRAIEPDLIMDDVRPMAAIVDDSVRDTKLLMWLMGLFAIVATTLAAVGIYGLTAYLVRQRQREIGVRVAVGATPSRLLTMVLREGLALAVAGVALGLFLTFLAAKSAEAVLFNVSSFDALSVAGAGILMLVVAVAATIAPAMTAARVPPATALRAD